MAYFVLTIMKKVMKPEYFILGDAIVAAFISRHILHFDVLDHNAMKAVRIYVYCYSIKIAW